MQKNQKELEVDDAMDCDIDKLLCEFFKRSHESGSSASWFTFGSAWIYLSFAVMHHVVPVSVEPPDFLQLWFEVILDRLFADPPPALASGTDLGMPATVAWKLGLVFALYAAYETQLLEPKECIRVSPAYWSQLALDLQELESYTVEARQIICSLLQKGAFCFCASGGPVGLPRAIRRPSKSSHDPALVYPPSTTESIYQQREDESKAEPPPCVDVTKLIDYEALNKAAEAYTKALTIDQPDVNARLATSKYKSYSSSSLFVKKKKRPSLQKESPLLRASKNSTFVPRPQSALEHLLGGGNVAALRKCLQDVETVLSDETVSRSKGRTGHARETHVTTTTQRRGESLIAFQKRTRTSRNASSRNASNQNKTDNEAPEGTTVLSTKKPRSLKLCAGKPADMENILAAEMVSQSKDQDTYVNESQVVTTAQRHGEEVDAATILAAGIVSQSNSYGGNAQETNIVTTAQRRGESLVAFQKRTSRSASEHNVTKQTKTDSEAALERTSVFSTKRPPTLKLRSGKLADVETVLAAEMISQSKDQGAHAYELQVITTAQRHGEEVDMVTVLPIETDANCRDYGGNAQASHIMSTAQRHGESLTAFQNQTSRNAFECNETKMGSEAPERTNMVCTKRPRTLKLRTRKSADVKAVSAAERASQSRGQDTHTYELQVVTTAQKHGGEADVATVLPAESNSKCKDQGVHVRKSHTVTSHSSGESLIAFQTRASECSASSQTKTDSEAIERISGLGAKRPPTFKLRIRKSAVKKQRSDLQ